MWDIFATWLPGCEGDNILHARTLTDSTHAFVIREESYKGVKSLCLSMPCHAMKTPGEVEVLLRHYSPQHEMKRVVMSIYLFNVAYFKHLVSRLDYVASNRMVDWKIKKGRDVSINCHHPIWGNSQGICLSRMRNSMESPNQYTRTVICTRKFQNKNGCSPLFAILGRNKCYVEFNNCNIRRIFSTKP